MNTEKMGIWGAEFFDNLNSNLPKGVSRIRVDDGGMGGSYGVYIDLDNGETLEPDGLFIQDIGELAFELGATEEQNQNFDSDDYFDIAIYHFAQIIDQEGLDSFIRK